MGDVQPQKCARINEPRLCKVAENRVKEAQKCEAQLGSVTNCIIEAESNAKLGKLEQRVASEVAVACGEGNSSPIACRGWPGLRRSGLPWLGPCALAAPVPSDEPGRPFS